jgi:hypothetical protein
MGYGSTAAAAVPRAALGDAQPLLALIAAIFAAS